MPAYLAYLQLTLATFLWGGTFVSARVLSQDLSPVLAAFYRFALAATVLLLWFYWVKRAFPKPRGLEWLWLLLMGASGVALYNLLFFYGMHQVEAARGSLLITTSPLFITLLSLWVLKERWRKSLTLGFLSCSAGVAVVMSQGQWQQLFNHQALLPQLALIGSAASWAVYTHLGRALMPKYSPQDLVLASAFIGSTLLLPIAWWWHEFQLPFPVNAHVWGHLIYMAVFGTVFGFVLYYRGIRQIGASRASVFVYLVPVTATLMGALLLHETPGWEVLLGGILIVSGIAIINKPPNKRR